MHFGGVQIMLCSPPVVRVFGRSTMTCAYIGVRAKARTGGEKEKKDLIYHATPLHCYPVTYGLPSVRRMRIGKGFFLYIPPVRLSRAYIYIYIYIIRTYDLK